MPYEEDKLIKDDGTESFRELDKLILQALRELDYSMMSPRQKIKRIIKELEKH